MGEIVMGEQGQRPLPTRALGRISARVLAFAAPTFAALALAGCDASPPGIPDASVAEITAFADAFDAAQIAQDGAQLRTMVADDLVFIDGEGQRQGKREFIAGWTGAGDRFDAVKLSDRIITPLGRDAGLVSAEAILSGVSAGEPFRARIRFTDIFRRRDGRWQAAHIQVTRLPAAAPPAGR